MEAVSVFLGAHARISLLAAEYRDLPPHRRELTWPTPNEHQPKHVKFDMLVMGKRFLSLLSYTFR